MLLDGTETRFLAILRESPVKKVFLDQLQESFSKACPELNNQPERRFRLAHALENLATAGLIALPANRKKDWQNFTSPALPNWLRVVREKVELRTERFEHTNFPWVEQMRFLAALPFIPSPRDALKLHKFFKNGGQMRPVVPIKERSWDIFGDEKRLEEILAGKLFFGPGRLSLDMIRCRRVCFSLLYQLSTKHASEPAIILENEATFHSFARLNSVTSKYAGVIFGNGQAVLKGREFLIQLSRSLQQVSFLYFGDLDSSGLRIPATLSQLLKSEGITLRPAESFYEELLSIAEPEVLAPQRAAAAHLAWLPDKLASASDERLRRSGRVAQEALGWERLSVIFSIDPETDFYAGF